MDGQVELLVSHSGGTGFFTYTSFYNVDKNGKLKERQREFILFISKIDVSCPLVPVLCKYLNLLLDVHSGR